MRLRGPASCALHPHRELASYPQVQGLDLEEDTPTLEHSTYNFDELSMLLQFLHVTSSEFFTQPKCPMAHPPQASTPASELSASCTSNPTTVLKTNTHLHPPPPTISFLDWLHLRCPLLCSSSKPFTIPGELTPLHQGHILGWSGCNIVCKLSQILLKNLCPYVYKRLKIFN